MAFMKVNIHDIHSYEAIGTEIFTFMSIMHTEDHTHRGIHTRCS